MARLRIIYSPKTGKKMAEFKDGDLVWYSDEYIAPSPDKSAMVMGDIQPYTSQIDGSLIESRSKHRAHLKQHNCIEIGNETKHLKPHVQKPPPGLKEELIRVANDKLRYR